MNYAKSLSDCGLAIPELLLPRKSVSLDKWAVVACDQFSSDKDYWKNVEDYVGQAPSTLNLILPECYLDETESRVPNINETMKSYLDQGILESAGTGFLYLERSTPWTRKREGLIVALDLESYSYELGVNCQIRPTEGTVMERLPVRAQIKKNAVLDLPHILVLINDPEKKLFTALEKRKKSFKKVYDFDLASEAGHLKGSMVSDPESLETIASVFKELKEESDFLFAVGDGNHSLGAAKQLWNKIKAETGDMNHPARYALVELENIHDQGVHFEPIHRVLFDCPFIAFKEDLQKYPGVELSHQKNWSEMKCEVEELNSRGIFALGVISSSELSLLKIEDPESFLVSEALHKFLDPWMEKVPCGEIDYIHGEKALKELSESEGNIGFYLPSINKDTFFQFISQRGPMPRKTFSIGEAEEKRYYLESRKLIY